MGNTQDLLNIYQLMFSHLNILIEIFQSGEGAREKKLTRQIFGTLFLFQNSPHNSRETNYFQISNTVQTFPKRKNGSHILLNWDSNTATQPRSIENSPAHFQKKKRASTTCPRDEATTLVETP
jgi:hypothetical protein